MKLGDFLMVKGSRFKVLPTEGGGAAGEKFIFCPQIFRILTDEAAELLVQSSKALSRVQSSKRSKLLEN